MTVLERPSTFARLDEIPPVPPVRKAPPPMIDEIEWLDDLTPNLESSYLVKGLLDRGAMSVVYGPSNCGKTFFAIDLAYCVAGNREWRGKRINGGKVLYLAAEGGAGVVNRLAAIRDATGDKGVQLAVRRASIDLKNPDGDVGRVIGLARQIAPEGLALIVVDTLSRAMAGADENSAVDMTAFVGAIDRLRQETGAHVMVVHHSGKDAAKGARGHSSLRAATDTEIEIIVDDTGERRATTTKQRDLAGGETYHFGLKSVDLGQDQDGDPVRTCIVEHRDTSGQGRTRKPVRLSDREELALRALHDAVGEDGQAPPHGFDLPAGIRVVSIDSWRNSCYCSQISDSDKPDSRLKAFKRAADRLQRLGLVGVREDRAWAV